MKVGIIVGEPVTDRGEYGAKSIQIKRSGPGGRQGPESCIQPADGFLKKLEGLVLQEGLFR